MPRKFYIILSLLLLLALSVIAKDMTASEAEFKAKFIVDLFDDVTWPDNAPRDADGAMVIGVVGSSPLTARLTEFARTKSSGNTRIKVKVFDDGDDFTACRVLFMATEDKTELAQILKKVKNAPVLTVSDAYYFARYGVMVNFYTEESSGKEKVKFEVNTMTMGFVGIKMKSTLLELATVI